MQLNVDLPFKGYKRKEWGEEKRNIFKKYDVSIWKGNLRLSLCLSTPQLKTQRSDNCTFYIYRISHLWRVIITAFCELLNYQSLSLKWKRNNHHPSLKRFYLFWKKPCVHKSTQFRTELVSTSATVSQLLFLLASHKKEC